MIRKEWRMPLLAVVSATFLATTGTADATSQTAADEAADEAAFRALSPVTTHPLCADAPVGFSRCFAQVVDGTERPRFEDPVAPFAPSGLGPADLRSAYNLPTSGGNGRIVAIVDANDSPTAESDLATYRSQFGLPPCTSANGCFKKVNQDGQTSPLPAADSGWAGEISLDIDMVSAVCPDCKILLVEANSANNSDLATAVKTAAAMGAAAISNSYGGAEDSSVANDTTYKFPGVLVTASSGDSAYAAGPQTPAGYPFVLGVGGTSLTKSASSRGWAEKAWKSGGSGCSKYVAKPSFQTDTGCTKRTIADVSAVGDPQTGVAVYNRQWEVVGGTSASSPIVASIMTLFNLAGNAPSFAYKNPTAWYDVTSGANGSCSGAVSYVCTAGAGYDGPTGLGTPNGTVLATLSGNPPPPPPPQDAAPPPHDAAPPSQDSGAGGQPDSGAVADSGSGGEVDSGSTGGHDSGSSGNGNGGNDSGLAQDAASGGNSSGSADTTDTTPPQGCGCSVPGSDQPLGDAGRLGAAFAIGLAFMIRRKKR